ncbi:MAG TPA: ABC transporter substrate-binding protein [Candidatus Limnocylindrales bacterium]|nr:ABC transporter substrate-binding protein [Candidatus Limnocylindrales bacterium]
MTASEIVIGSCSALDGPARQLGLQMVMGATAYFDMVNEQGGVNGRKLRLVAYDDGYDPEKAPSCFARLQKDRIFAGAFFVGTPTAARYLPLAEEKKLPIVGLFTGAQILYDPFHHYVMNVRASYYDETREQVNNLLALGMKKIAVLHPNDAFGAAVLEGVKIALKKHGLALAAVGVYPRNTTEVGKAMETVRSANPDAVVLVGPYAPVAEIVRQAKREYWSPLFLTVSFVGTDDFIHDAGPDAEGTIITQVVPSYQASDLPTVALYRKELQKYFSNARPGFVSLEGFVDAMVLVEGLKRAGKDLTREKLVRALESVHDFDTGLGPRLKLNFSPVNHKGFHNVYPTVVRGGVAVPFSDWSQFGKVRD